MKRFSEVKEIKFVLEEMSNFDKQTLLGDIEEIIEESLRKKWATWL